MGKKARLKKLRQLGGIEPLGKEEKEKSIVRILLWLIRGGVFISILTPLIVSGKFYFPFVGPKSLYFMALAEIVIFSYIALQFVSSKYRPQINALTIALLAFFLIMLAAGIFGVSFTNSFWSKFERMTGILMWLHLLGFFFVIVAVFKKDKDWQKIMAVSLLVAIIAAVMSLTKQGGSTRGGATIGNTSFLGTYLLFNVFFAVYLFFKQKKLYLKIPAGLISLLLIFAVYFAHARAAALSIFGGLTLLVFAFLAFVPKYRWLKVAGRALLMLSLIAFMVSVFLLFQEGSFVRDWFIKRATRSRLVIWEVALGGLKDRPVLGWGPENFEFAFEKYFNPCVFTEECGSEIWFDRAHNIIFDWLSAAGILGLLGYFSIFLTAFFITWQAYLKKKIDFWQAAVPSVTLIAYSVQNLTVFDMISSYLMFFIVLGFISAFIGSFLEKKEKQVKKKVFKTNPWPFGFLGLAFAACLIFFVIQPARESRAVIEALKAEEFDSRFSYYEDAFSYSPMGRFQIREFLASKSESLINQSLDQVESLQQLNQDLIKKELDLVIGELDKTMQAVPEDFRTQLKLSHLYILYSFFDFPKLGSAEEAAKKAVELSPANQQGYWALSQIMVYSKQYDKALEAAQEAVDLEPKWYQSHSVAVQVAKMAGQDEKIAEIIARAKEIMPSWENQLRAVAGWHPLDNTE